MKNIKKLYTFVFYVACMLVTAGANATLITYQVNEYLTNTDNPYLTEVYGEDFTESTTAYITGGVSFVYPDLMFTGTTPPCLSVTVVPTSSYVYNANDIFCPIVTSSTVTGATVVVHKLTGSPLAVQEAATNEVTVHLIALPDQTLESAWALNNS